MFRFDETMALLLPSSNMACLPSLKFSTLPREQRDFLTSFLRIYFHLDGIIIIIIDARRFIIL